jgi:tripartite-type tricarboxylate transporter receptor subunit TctC
MKMTVLRLLVFLAATAALAGPTPLRAQDGAAFYKGKTVKFVVGFGTGGGFDAYARMIAPPLGKVLDANIIVENQPGAGGIIALNRIAAGPADGLALMIVDGTPAALGQLLGQENVRYDLTKVDHLGMISATRFAWLVPMGSNLKSAADATGFGKRMLFASSGPTDGPTGSAAFTCEALRISCKVILGYKGSSDMILAMQRGEVDANFLSESSSSALVKSGQARVIAVISRTRSPLLPDVATLFEQATLDADQQWLLDFRANLNDLGRILVTSPGTDTARLAALRTAIKTVLTDPGLVAEGFRTSRVLEYQPSQAALDKAAQVLSAVSPEQKERIRTIALKKYLE